jgi:short-subunit dehydrogenase
MKVVLITGCSSGFGYEMVQKFLNQGWTVIATLRQAENRLDLFQNHLAKFQDRLFIKTLDVTSQKDRSDVSQFIREKFNGQLNCLINNAGKAIYGSIEDASEEQLRNQLEVNYFGLAFLTKELLPYLRKNRGKIINLSSTMGFWSAPMLGLYSSSKFAVEGLSEALYYELKPFGVQVCIVEPGQFKTTKNDNYEWAKSSNQENSVYSKQTQAFLNIRKKMIKNNTINEIQKVATKIVSLAEVKCMPLRKRIGKDACALFLIKKILPERIFSYLMKRSFRRSFYSAGNI